MNFFSEIVGIRIHNSELLFCIVVFCFRVKTKRTYKQCSCQLCLLCYLKCLFPSASWIGSCRIRTFELVGSKLDPTIWQFLNGKLNCGQSHRYCLKLFLKGLFRRQFLLGSFIFQFRAGLKFRISWKVGSPNPESIIPDAQNRLFLNKAVLILIWCFAELSTYSAWVSPGSLFCSWLFSLVSFTYIFSFNWHIS